MKVLQVSKLFPPFWGGLETVVYDITQDLTARNIEMSVLCVSHDKTEEFSKIDNVIVYRCKSVARIASTYLSWTFIKTWKKIRNSYQIIHIHLPNPLATLAIFLFPTKAKIIIHWHSDIVKQKFLKILFKPLQNWILNKSDLIIVTSHSYASSSIDLKPYFNKVRVIPIGISTNRLTVEQTYNENLSHLYQGKRIIFALGRHVYYKGFEYLIDAMKYLPSEYMLILGGSGELTPSLKKQIHANKLDSRVVLVGSIPANQLGAYYDVCDVFCLPSIERSEAFGVVQLEAMSFGKPVVSTKIVGSGVPWVNKHKLSGLTVPIKDAKSLADSIIEATTSKQFKKSDILKYFNENFLREKMGYSIYGLYKELVS